MSANCGIAACPPFRTADFRLDPSLAKVGMFAFLLSEVAFFSTLITTYVVFLRETKDSDPSPAEVFHLPLVLVGTACLLSSSVTIHFAERAFGRGRRAAFLRLVGTDDSAGRHVSGLHRQGMARADFQRWADDQPQFVRQHAISRWSAFTRCT